MIGGLRRELSLFTLTRSDDEAGGHTVSLQSIGVVWARVEFLSSVRDFLGDRRNRLRRIAAQMRAHSALALGDIVQLESVNFEIVSIEGGEDRTRDVTLIAEEVSAL